jgi:hypothetical protein
VANLGPERRRVGLEHRPLHLLIERAPQHGDQAPHAQLAPLWIARECPRSRQTDTIALERIHVDALWVQSIVVGARDGRGRAHDAGGNDIRRPVRDPERHFAVGDDARRDCRRVHTDEGIAAVVAPRHEDPWVIRRRVCRIEMIAPVEHLVNMQARRHIEQDDERLQQVGEVDDLLLQLDDPRQLTREQRIEAKSVKP